MRIAALAPVEAAAAWFLAHEEHLLERQMEVTRIAAPPFGEAARAEWLAARFRELGLTTCTLTALATSSASAPALRRSVSPSTWRSPRTLIPCFRPGTGVNVRREGNRLYGPGISDNGAGITALLALAGAMGHADIHTEWPLVFVGNVGEEGEGDVRGMRYIFAEPRWRDAIEATIVLDGAGTDTIVTEALGSKRFLVTIFGPGGHSWSDFGTANPIVVLARAIDLFARTPVPASPKTTFNIGVITGGTSVNSIPESAAIKVDIRSAAGEQVERMERALRDAVERAVAQDGRTSFGGRSRERTGRRHQVDRQPSRRAPQRRQPHARFDPGGGRAAGQQRPPATRLHRRQHPALAGTRCGGHRRRRRGRRRAHAARMVRPHRARPRLAADSAHRARRGRSPGMKIVAALLLFSAMNLHAQNTKLETPDQIFINGDIYTGAEEGFGGAPAKVYPRAQAMAVRNGRIMAVGTSDEIRKIKGPHTQVVDLGGRFVMPGFNDAHLHLANGGFEMLNVELSNTKSFDEMKARIAERVKTAAPGEWILGRGWDDTKWPVQKIPTRQDLDAITGDHPALFIRTDGHMLVANSAALRVAGVTKQHARSAGRPH